MKKINVENKLAICRLIWIVAVAATMYAWTLYVVSGLVGGIGMFDILTFISGGLWLIDGFISSYEFEVEGFQNQY